MAHSTRAPATAGFRTLTLALMRGGIAISACIETVIRLNMCVDAAHNPDPMADHPDCASALVGGSSLPRALTVAVDGLVLDLAVTSLLSVA